MQGYIIDKNGVETAVPELLGWDIRHVLYDACDSFEISVAYDLSLLPLFRSAHRFRASHGGRTVFFGVVDEHRISISERGAVISMNGRSLAAVLMDSEASKTTYYMMTKASLTENFLSPYGITDIAGGSMPQTLMFPIKNGDSLWTVVKRFCLRSMHTEPRFTAAGRLILDGALGVTKSLDADEKATELSYKDERYGIISHIKVTNRASGGSYTLTNPAFIQRGGNSRRIYNTDRFETVISNPAEADDRFTGQYRIDCSMRGKHSLRLKIPELFFCFAGDKLALNSTLLGLSGTYTVTESECRADALGFETLLTLEL